MPETTVILGGGESGTGAALLAKQLGHTVFLSEKGQLGATYKAQLDRAGVVYEEGGHSQDKVLQADTIIKSPGIPDTAELVQLAKASGIPVIDELLFAYRSVQRQAKFIAITGTNGKTTTTLLTYHLLKEAGFSVGLGGNVGQSMARQLAEGFKPEWWVLEVSSFQLDGMPGFQPNVAILTNITPDHLDRYAYKLENYVQSKLQIGLYQQPENVLITNGQDGIVREAVARAGLKGTLYSIGQPINQEPVAATFTSDTIEFRYPHPWVLPLAELPLKGKHNQQNIACAVLAARAAGAEQNRIEAALRSFKNAPHRLEPVGTVEGVRYVNDSKATNVDAAWYALDAETAPIVWIAGGVDKGNDYQQVAAVVQEKVAALVCLGTDNTKLTQFFGPKINKVVEAGSMREAIEKAADLARPHSGAVVLLSPCCASFDLFKNYEDRGRQFREEVLNLKKKKGV